LKAHHFVVELGPKRRPYSRIAQLGRGDLQYELKRYPRRYPCRNALFGDGLLDVSFEQTPPFAKAPTSSHRRTPNVLKKHRGHCRR